MHIRWSRQQLRKNKQTEVVCPHEHIQRPWTTSPVIVHQGKALWRPGPSIRECCITRGKGIAIAAWWWEVEQRFEELQRVGLPDPDVTESLRSQLDLIEEMLEETVPKPSRTERQRYIWYREDLGLTRQQSKLDPPGFKQLGLAWPCTREELDKRWKLLARQAHPDFNNGNADEFKMLSQAYRSAKAAFERVSM